MLELENVEAYYGESRVLQGISLSIQSGEFVSILGRNGVGKTTLIRSILGLMDRVDGSIRLDGTEIGRFKTHERAIAGIGYVPQGRGIFPTLSVLENLMIGVPRMRDTAQQEYVLTCFPRLKERLKQSGSTLSGGEQQMLAIARCLMMRPKLIILDEPTEGIMPRLVSQIRREIHRINQSGVSILLVEQNVETALKLCPRVFLMEKGTIVHSGASHELKSQPEIVHRYLGLSH
jgi:branched-chain amino acid transport system ATP-binding protein